ncbi:MAG: hypothetical protein QOD77_1855 [Thermoplasmata archaeon]|jgi:hypothetical protein|nr:hypothetical protein [Thermoplasmata archaeon]
MVDLNDQRAPELTDIHVGQFRLSDSGSGWVPPGDGSSPSDWTPGAQALFYTGVVVMVGGFGVGLMTEAFEMLLVGMFGGPLLILAGGIVNKNSTRPRAPKPARAARPSPPPGPSPEERARQRRRARERRQEARRERQAKRVLRMQRQTPPEAILRLHREPRLPLVPKVARYRVAIKPLGSLRAMRQAAAALRPEEDARLPLETLREESGRTFVNPGDADVPVMAVPDAGLAPLPPAVANDPVYLHLAEKDRALQAEAARLDAAVVTARALAAARPGGRADVELAQAKQARSQAEYLHKVNRKELEARHEVLRKSFTAKTLPIDGPGTPR